MTRLGRSMMRRGVQLCQLEGRLGLQWVGER